MTTGSSLNWCCGGGEDRVHSSVVAPSPHGLSAATVPVSVTYAVTPLGRTLMAAMQSIIDWAETRMPEVAAAQTAYDQRSCDAH